MDGTCDLITLFRDPFARRLAGERGARIAEGKGFANRNAWSFVARTVLFDRFIGDAVANGADMVSPALMRMMQKSMGQDLRHAGAPFKFAPDEGPAFFERAGWKPLEVPSLLHTAATLRRLWWRMRLIALLPDSAGRIPNSPWGGACLFGKISDSSASS